VRILDRSAGVGRSISEHGSRFVLVPLMRPADAARTVLLHLSVGDEIGAHEAGQRQLLVVLRGSGWVSGGDGARVAIVEDQAAVFEPGELHAAGTEVGMVAVSIEGEFELEV
jgi:hypothetical protein